MLKLKTFEETERDHARQRFDSEVSKLPALVGARNVRLKGICRTGLRAGMSDEEIYGEIMAGCGEPPVKPKKVIRAILRARSSLAG